MPYRHKQAICICVTDWLNLFDNKAMSQCLLIATIQELLFDAHNGTEAPCFPLYRAPSCIGEMDLEMVSGTWTQEMDSEKRN